MSKTIPGKLLLAVLLISVILSGTSCKKSSSATTITAPTVTTTNVILDVTSTTAQSGGTVNYTGTDAVTTLGVCYSSTNQTPTVADTKSPSTVSSVSYIFTCNITGLTPNTTYYLRAYATSGAGTGYGAVLKFTTSSSISSVIGNVTTFAGSGAAGFGDGNGTGSQFYNPLGMAADGSGNVYVADAFNNRIRKITPQGDVTTIAGNGKAGLVNGNALTDAEFYYPQGLTLDKDGNIFVADYGNNAIRKITVSTGVVTTFAGTGRAGFVDTTGVVAEFSGPSSIAIGPAGNFLVTDRNNNVIRRITPAGVVTTAAGVPTAGYVDATLNFPGGIYGAFNHPNGIAVDSKTGTIYISDGGNNAIRQITTGGVLTTIAGGPAQQTVIGSPSGICVDTQGDLFITDGTGRIIELTSAKVLYQLAGATNVFGFADGSGTDAQFNNPQGIAVDQSGNIYVADFNNNRIRKVVVTTTNH